MKTKEAYKNSRDHAMKNYQQNESYMNAVLSDQYAQFKNGVRNHDMQFNDHSQLLNYAVRSYLLRILRKLYEVYSIRTFNSVYSNLFNIEKKNQYTAFVEATKNLDPTTRMSDINLSILGMLFILL